MMETVETLEDVFTIQARLNRKKWILNQRTNQAMQDWLKLADEYAEIDSRANHAYCMNKAVAYGYTVAVEEDMAMEKAELPEPEFPQLPEEEFDWQKYAGD